MADRVEIRQVTVPAQTDQAAPFTDDISFDPGEVLEIEIVIPDGHAGITGIALSQGNGAITIPYSGNDWIVSNDEVLRFAYTDGIKTGSWQAHAYNQDFVNPHSFFIRFFISENKPATATVPTALQVSDITEAGAAAAVGAATEPLPAEPAPSGEVTTTTAPEATTGTVTTTDEAAADVSLEQDAGLLTGVAEGAQGDVPDLSNVVFAVAPPDNTPDAP